MKMICDNLSIRNGDLYFAGQRVSDLAETYGTPLYLMDEEKIREKCRIYTGAVKKAFGNNAQVLYASKAASFKRMYEIVGSEGLGVDVVSSGELHTALKAGFDVKNAYFHSNNKTDADIEYGIKSGVGYFVVDNEDELKAVDECARRLGKVQDILIRLTPGIDPHTYEAVATGKVDSKFGNAIVTGQALKITAEALSLLSVRLRGFHCHVGSQIFDSSVYLAVSEVMLGFMAEAKEKLGYEAEILDLGGGYGVRYVSQDPVIDIESNILSVGKAIKDMVKKLGINLPKICFEPGRSIVADAGMTVYTVGSVKRIDGYKNYVSVDGGIPDNVRYAMYGSSYTVLPAKGLNKTFDFRADVVGRCCESGDIIQPGIMFPSGISRGDYIAVLTTGAYNYSMASNYNRIPRPPVIMLSPKGNYTAVKRETLEYMTDLDV